MAPTKQTEPKPDDAAADDAVAPQAAAVPPGDDFELVYVCNPKLHGDTAAERPHPGRVTRAWLETHSEAGWVECDANGKTSKES